MKNTRVAICCKWIFFLFAFALVISKQAAAQTAIADPAGTTITSACTADTRSIGFPNGNTYSYANTGWPSCTAWGFSTSAAIPVCQANVLASNACTFNTVTYNAAAPTNLAGGVMCFTGTTNYRASNGSTTFGNVLTNIRMVVTVTDNSNNPMQLQVSGGYVYVVIPDPSFTFKAKVEIQAQGPAGVFYFTGGTGTTVPIGCTGTPNNTYTCASYLNAWVGAIQLYNCISTESTYKICTQFTGSTFLSAGVPVAPPTPTTSAATICPGGTATLSRGVGPPAAPLSGVTWYWQTGTTTGTDVTNSGATLAVTPASTTTYYLRPRVGTCWGTSSAGVTVTVVSDPAATTPTITNATVCAGNGSTVFSSNGSLGITPYTFNWQYDNGGYANVIAGTPPASTYTVAGTTPNSTLTVANITSPGTYNYRLRVSGGSGCAGVSAGTTLTVVADPTAPTLNVATPANNSTICVGGTVSATFNLSSNGTGGCTDNYRSSIDGGTTWLAYTPGATLTSVTAGANRIQIQTSRVCGGSGCDGPGETYATVAQWTVAADPTFTLQPVAGTICTGGTRALTATVSPVSGPVYTYDWQESNDNGVGDPWVTAVGGSGANTLSYTTPALTGNLYHRIQVTSTTGGCTTPINSNSVLTTVLADPTVTISGSADVCVGNSVVLTATPAGGSGTVVTYNWERSPVGLGTWTSVQNTTTATYPTSTALTAGIYDYRVTYTQTVSGCAVTSSIFQVTVSSPDIAIAQVPSVTAAPTTVCSGSAVTLTSNGLVPGGQGSNISGVITLAGSQYVTVTYPVNNSLQTPGDFTYEMWVRPTSWTTLNTYFSNGLWNGQCVLFRQDNNTTVNLYISNVAIGSLAYAPPLNVWTHLALVRSGATIGLYANGCRVGNFTTSYATAITPTTNLVIGASTHALTESFRGQIDNFRLWKGVALPVATMNSWRTLQASASHPNWANLSCEYRFNGDYTNSGPAGGSGTGVMTGGGFAAPTCYTYTWTGSGTWTTSGAPAATTNEVQTANPTNTTGAATTGSYTVIASRSGYTSSPVSAATATITVNPLPAAPTPVTASPTSFCIAANTIQLNATAAGSTIYWYTVASGGANIGISASGANFTVNPVATTTYYAEARNITTNCISATRTAVTVTLVATPGTSSPIEGTTTICVGATSALMSPLATGGNITKSGGYRIHAFYSNGTLNIANAANVEVLVVGGGGGGGFDMGGGGGAGGVIVNNSFPATPGSYAITVGAGGKGAPAGSTLGQPGAHQFTQPAANGGNSVFSSLTAVGGGRGGSSVWTYTPGWLGNAGGSGGGASGYNSTAGAGSGAGTVGQGNRGGNAGGSHYSGGGGGAGGAGGDGPAQPNGGVGVSNSILGPAYFWGGGGGGSAYTAATGGNGGNGGGGGGAVGVTTGGAGLNNGCGGGGGSPGAQTNTHGANAGANTGGGGGGGSHYNAYNSGGGGGSGIVVVRYLDVSANGTWSSSAPGVATVNPTTGVVTAVAPGTTTISFLGTNGICSSSAPVTTVVTVLALPAAPTSADVAICAGGTANISATSAGNLIKWYTAATGGSLVGVTASGVNLSVTPGSTTTYYAEAVANNPYATGGIITTSGAYRIHRFNASADGPFVVTQGGNMEVLLVGGGGGGGSDMGGGGGAGGVIMNNSFAVAAGSFPVTVGTGGAGAPAGVGQVSGSNGTNSVFSTLTAIGGGGGGSEYANNTQPGRNGGSGGGCAGYLNTTFGLGTAGQGYNGGASGGTYVPSGGGGAGGPGLTNPSHGGPGIASQILGTTYYFGGGGGGAGYSMIGGNGGKGGGGGGGGGITLGGTGGLNNGAAGGGGALVQQCNRPGGNAGANTGGGGGGGSHYNLTNAGGAGGSGIVVVRYIDAGCSSPTRTPVVVTVNPLPADIAPTAAATTVCNNTGTNIQIAGSQSGVNYQLRLHPANTNVGTAVAGTGGTINLPTGNLTATTTFNVLATNPTTTCFRQMTTTVTVTVYSDLTGASFIYTNPISCTTSNGTITITPPTGGSGTYNYSRNSTDGSNGTWQVSASYTGIADGASGQVWVRNAAVPYCPVYLGSYNMQEPYEPIAAPTAASNISNLCSSNIATLTASGLTPGIQHGVFNGSSYVTLGTGAPLNITGSQTIEMWLYPTSFAVRRNPYAKAYGGEGTITQEINGTLNYYYGTSGANAVPFQSFNSGVSLPLNTWTHVAIVRDLSAMTLKWYFNGNLVSSGTASYAAAVASALAATIGTGYTNPYSGNIESVKIWNGARTLAQIQADMYLADPSVSTNLVANYKFNGDFTGAPSGPTGTNTGVTFANQNFYTYTWTGAVPGGSNPTPSTLEVQTSGPLTGTSSFQVTASANGCSGLQSNAVPVNDFGGAYTVTLEAAGSGNAVNVVLPGNSTGPTYGRPGVGAETSAITASGGGAWDRCVNWGLPVVSTATYGPRIGFGSANNSMTYLAQGQPNSTTNLASGIVCYTASVAPPANAFCTNATCTSFITANLSIRITLTLLTPANAAIPLDYTSSGHIVMRAGQNFKIRQKVEILAPTATYYGSGVNSGGGVGCNNYSTAGTWYPILEWYDCVYKNSAPQFYYSFNYNSFPKFTFTSGIDAGTDFTICVGGQPASRIDLQGDLGGLAATCGTLLHYWEGPSGYVSAGTLLAPTGTQSPSSFVTSTSPTTFGTYNYTVSQGPVTSSNICYGTSSVNITQNVAVVNGGIWSNGAPGTTYYGTPVPAYLDPTSQVTGNDSWYDNRNWDHCVPDAATNSYILYNATNPANINSNVAGYWGANAATKFLKIDVPNNAKLIINANGTTKLNVTD